MDTLKKIILITGLTLLFNTAMAQSTAVVEAAFAKSYVAEKDNDYTAAINSLKSVYKSDSYIMNIRLGWLYYLAKQYTESISYYNKSIALMPYAIEARFGCIKPLS